MGEGAVRGCGPGVMGHVCSPTSQAGRMCACVGAGGGSPGTAHGRRPPLLPEPCWARGDTPQKQKQAALLAFGSGSRTFNSNPRTHSPSRDPSSIPPPQDSSHHRPHSTTTTSLQKPSAHPRASGNLFIFCPFCLSPSGFSLQNA